MYSCDLQIRKGDNCKEMLLGVAEVFQYHFHNHDFGQWCFSHKTCSKKNCLIWKKNIACKDVFKISRLYFLFLIFRLCHFAIWKRQENKANCDKIRKNIEIMVSCTVLFGKNIWKKYQWHFFFFFWEKILVFSW